MSKVIVVFGLPGSGKSFFAKKLALKIGAEYCNTDLVRKKLFKQRVYSDEEQKVVYQVLVTRMIECLKLNRDIVLDGTFYKENLRQNLMDEAHKFSIIPHLIRVYADEMLVRQRLSKTRQDSEANYNIYCVLKKAFEPATVAHLSLESKQENIRSMLEKAVNYLSNDKKRTLQAAR